MSESNGGVVGPLMLLFLLISSPVVSAEDDEFPVAKRSLNRPDPLRGLKDYDGDYNVTNKHYWASAAFTGVHSYGIAGAWMLCGLGLGIFVACKSCCISTTQSSPAREHSNHYYFIMFFLIILFTFLAIMATRFVMAANESSLHRAKKFKATIIKAGDDTHRNIRKIVTVMTEMQSLLRPYDPGTSMKLYTITHLLADESNKIQFFIKKSGHAIDLAIQTSHIIHIVVVTVNVAFLLASLVVLLFHWHPGYITIIFIFWILTTTSWGLAGIDFFLYTFAGDTCTAFKDFDQNPKNSSLGSLIPCVDPSFSVKLLAEIGYTVHNFISQLNTKVTELHMLFALRSAQSLNFLGLGKICDPFSGPPNYTYIPESCKDSIPIGELPNILSLITCHKEDSSESCASNGKIIPQTFYEMARAYSKSVQDLLNIFPDLESLTKCIIVKMTFSNLVKNQCKPFRVSIRMLWASILCLAVFMVVLVLIWVAKAYQEKGRHFSRCSILPQIS